MKHIRHIVREPTAEEQNRHDAIRAEIEQEKPEIRALARRFQVQQKRLQQALADLKAAREAQGLSLEEIGARTGIGKTNLSRLENARNPNPKIDTLARYADAVGLDLVIRVKAKGRN